MAANRVFYDTESLLVVAVHPVDQAVTAALYETDGRSIGTLIADAEAVPTAMEEVQAPAVDEDGRPVVGPDGKPVRGRIIDVRPRRLTEEWIEANVAPLQETIDGTKGKLALLDADKLDAFEQAIEAIADAKEKRAAQLKFNAQTWSRSDPVWNKLAKASKTTIKAFDTIWRAAVAG